MNVWAKEGCITIVLPKGSDAAKFSYSKVGDMVQGEYVLLEEYAKSGLDLNHLETAKELQQAAEILKRYSKQGGIVTVGEDGVARIEGLEVGVYLIDDYGDSSYEIVPTLLYLPTWQETEEEMLYDILLEPKMEHVRTTPQTGDDHEAYRYGLMLCGAGGILFLSYFCKKRKQFL